MKLLFRTILALSLVLAFAVPQAHAGLVVNVTFNDASFAGFNLTDVHNAFNYAASEYQNLFTDNVHLNLVVQGGNTGLGSSSTNLVGFLNYAQTRAALLADYAANPDANRNTAGANLSVADPTGGGSFIFAKAEAKALGIIADDASTDGTITFSNAQSYTFDPNNRAVAGKYDFIGVAEHEISEIMGRIPILGANFGSGSSYDPNDLFRYTANGVHSLHQNDANVYLSINGGATNLQGFNPNNGGDVSDYNGSNPTDPYNAFTASGQGHAISSVDKLHMDIMGWDLKQSTPEPGSLTLLVMGLAGLAGLSWKRKNDRS